MIISGDTEDDWGEADVTELYLNKIGVAATPDQKVFVEGLAAAYRDRFSLQVRGQGAGLEDGRRGQTIGAWARASLWTAPAATVSQARGSKSGSPLGGEGARGTGAKLA